MVARVQNNGLARITALLVAAAWYLQWGTGSGAAASANAVTTTSTTEARVAATASQQTGTVTNDKMRLTGTLTAADSRAITEIGVFDAAGLGSRRPSPVRRRRQNKWRSRPARPYRAHARFPSPPSHLHRRTVRGC